MRIIDLIDGTNSFVRLINNMEVLIGLIKDDDFFVLSAIGHSISNKRLTAIDG